MAENTATEEKPKRRRKRRSDGGEANEAAIMEAEAVEERGLTEGKGRATPGKRSRAQETDQGNIITRPLRGMRAYFFGVRDELRKVTWPTREELTRLTIMTLVVTIAASIVLGIISAAYSELFVIGLTNGQEWVFVVFGAFVALAALAIYRYNANSRDDSPY